LLSRLFVFHILFLSRDFYLMSLVSKGNRLYWSSDSFLSRFTLSKRKL